MSEHHPDWDKEVARLSYTLDYVEKSRDAILNREGSLAEDVKQARRHYQSDNSQAYIDLLINTTIYEGLQLKLRNLEGAVKKPYFARIDYQEEGKNEVEELYIGKMCLMRDEDKRLLIVDWRAPVANLYYEGRLGEASYQCPQGMIDGELSLKRQYGIKDGKLKEVFDIDITTNDEFLQQYLGANAENRLKDIVSTIQVEQNQIIRAPMEIPLIIQGVAGSGKTTIALHRIAYLIYNYQQNFKPENFMIIAPNRLFLNYISEVLPELGVERVKQTTFVDLAMELIAEKIGTKDPYHKLIAFVDHNVDAKQQEFNRKVRKVAEFKSSIEFKNVLENYVEYIENNFLPEEDFGVAGWIVYTYDQIKELFFRDYQHWPFYKRVEQLKKHFKKRLKDQRDTIVRKILTESTLKIDRLKLNMPESPKRQQIILKVIEQKEAKMTAIESFVKEGIKNYTKKIPKVTAYQYYQRLFKNRELFEKLFADKLDQECRHFMRDEILASFKSGKLDYEDLAPIIFLKYHCYGWDERFQVRHVVIDEAQDFSVFQFYMFHKVIKDSSFTILGDLNQGIHAYRGVQNWRQVQEEVFGADHSKILTLEQSYRTTAEIMNAANQVLTHLTTEILLAKPVIRHGAPVEKIKSRDKSDMISRIRAKISRLKQEQFNSIAVICKTSTEAADIYEDFKDSELKPTLIGGIEEEYHAGIVLLPSYLAKGLEFDAVIIANASLENYQENEMDTKLLYVAMTRPLHRLSIYYYGTISPLLAGLT